MINRKKPPDTPINLASMLKLIAQFGGYLNRSNDGEQDQPQYGLDCKN